MQVPTAQGWVALQGDTHLAPVPEFPQMRPATQSFASTHVPPAVTVPAIMQNALVAGGDLRRSARNRGSCVNL